MLYFYLYKTKKKRKGGWGGKGEGGEEIEKKNISFPVDIAPGHCVCKCERFACTPTQGLDDITAE